MKTIKEYKNYYENATKEEVIEDMFRDINYLQEIIEKAIDKLYCYGEVLDTDFQQEMLLILKDLEEEMK